MKVSFKQACEIEGKEYGPRKKQPRVFDDVPGYFVFLWFFVALLKDGKAEVLEVSDEDIKEMEEASKSERFKDVEPDPMVISIIESGSDSSGSGDSSIKSESTEGSEQQTKQTESSEKLPASEGIEQQVSEVKEEDKKADEPSAEELEYAELHEKAKRLNKKEKERYAELKAKLGIEE